jgi:hypothetical protein
MRKLHAGYIEQIFLLLNWSCSKGRAPPLKYCGQSSWLKIQRSEFDSRCYQIFWEVVGLERGPLNLMSTIQELLGRKSSGSGLESREYDRRDPSCWPRGTLYPQKFGTNFADMRRSLSGHSSLTDSGHGVFCLFVVRSNVVRLEVHMAMAVSMNTFQTSGSLIQEHRMHRYCPSCDSVKQENQLISNFLFSCLFAFVFLAVCHAVLSTAWVHHDTNLLTWAAVRTSIWTLSRYMMLHGDESSVEVLQCEQQRKWKENVISSMHLDKTPLWASEWGLWRNETGRLVSLCLTLLPTTKRRSKECLLRYPNSVVVHIAVFRLTSNKQKQFYQAVHFLHSHAAI